MFVDGTEIQRPTVTDLLEWVCMTNYLTTGISTNLNKQKYANNSQQMCSGLLCI